VIDSRHRNHGRTHSPARAGLTLIELVVVLAIVAALSLVLAPLMTTWSERQELKAAARAAGDLLSLARSEAIRTGNNHVVFFGPDPAGTGLVDDEGNFVPMLALDDGTPATANCRIEAGEARETISPEGPVSWGVTHATGPAPGDANGATFAAPQAIGHTFIDPAGNPANWVLFRPDGLPVVFTGAFPDCGVIGPTGTGGAAFYITNGKRDYSLVLTPLGGVRVHAWNEKTNQWGT
jgi:prepilin-type N-terminal cleavage/methylation domain-containing protein